MNKFSKIAAISAVFTATIFASCEKDKKNTDTVDFNTLKTQVLSDFVTVVGNPLYATFKDKATALKVAVDALSADATQANLIKAQEAWKAVRVVWEQSEGFLIGPVDDNNYDPYMDTWPTDHNAMDSLLNSNTPLTVAYIAGLDDTDDEVELTLRGFHPLEYLLWNTDGNRQANTFTAREKEYMTALAADILNNVTALQESWLPGNIHFANELTNPGSGTSRYASKKDALDALANSIIDICGEVGEGKLLEPFALPGDSTITESPYSHNSVADFKNNIIGARNVYLCAYDGKTGKSLSDLVKANNAALDQDIKQSFEAAINSFGGITTTFEQAIFSQRTQVQNTITAINALKGTIDAKLLPYIQQYVKD